MTDHFKEYSIANRYISTHRDGCTCRMCGNAATENDHVFGRGGKNNWLKEHWSLRMSMCRSCHYQKHHGSGFDRVKQAKVLHQANLAFIDSGEHNSVMFAITQRLRDIVISDVTSGFDFAADWLIKNGS